MRLADSLCFFNRPLSDYLQYRAQSDNQCFKTNISSPLAVLHSSPSPNIQNKFSISYCLSHHFNLTYYKSKNYMQTVDVFVIKKYMRKCCEWYFRTSYIGCLRGFFTLFSFVLWILVLFLAHLFVPFIAMKCSPLNKSNCKSFYRI